MNVLLQSLKTLGPLRLFALGIVTLATLGFLLTISVRAPHERMSLLYADLDFREVGRISDVLDRQHIPTQLMADGSQIFVASDQVMHARVLLAKEGLPSGGSIGYEIFDRSDGFAANAFQQRINQLRALEGELARTVRTIAGVRAARIHLVLPTREPFARTAAEATASVMIETNGAGRLDRESVAAITNLVAAAVPGLKPQAISVVDNRGTLLARPQDDAGVGPRLEHVEDMRRQMETRTQRAVEAMLERSLGAGRVRVTAAIDVDYEQVREQQERFDPDGQVLRSTQSNTSTNRTTEQAAATSVQNNLPNADASGTGGAGSQEQKQDEVSNFEIGKSVRTTTRDQPTIKRISLAVLVDGTETRGADGVVAWRARTPEELEQIQRLVKSAVGFDAKRGDQIDIVNMQFAKTEDASAVPASAGLLGSGLERADLIDLARPIAVAVIALLALMFVLRPMMLRLTALPTGGDALALGQGMGGTLTRTVDAAGRPMLDAAARNGGPAALGFDGGGDAGGADMTEEDSLVHVANIEGQLRSSSVRKITALAEKHPDETLAIVRAWMQEGTS